MHNGRVTRSKRTVDPEALLRDCERWPTNIVWPAPIDERLRTLVEAAVSVGENPSLSRSELLAALVFGATNDGLELSALLRRYRTAKARDTLPLPVDTAGQVISLSARRPGRRPQ